MNRTTMLALLILAALLLTGGTVLAKSIECTGGPCIGTKRGDSIFGVAGTDQIDGHGGGDDIFGDPRSGSAGNDTIHGGGGGDKITDSGDAGSNEDIDHIFAEKGDDVINVREGGRLSRRRRLWRRAGHHLRRPERRAHKLRDRESGISPVPHAVGVGHPSPARFKSALAGGAAGGTEA